MKHLLVFTLAACAAAAYADGMPDEPCSKPDIQPHLMEPTMPKKDKHKDDEVREVSEPGTILLTGLGLASVVTALGLVGRRRRKSK